MAEHLQGKCVAIVAGDGVDASELLEPLLELQEAGVEAVIVSRSKGPLQTSESDALRSHPAPDPASGPAAPDRTEALAEPRVSAEEELQSASPDRFAAVAVVGDYASTERLRSDPALASFLGGFFEQDKPVAALDHGAALVLEATRLYGRRLTCAESLKEDLDYAGAHWQAQPVVVDGNLITGHGREDAPLLSRRLVQALISHSARRWRLARPALLRTPLGQGG